MKHGLGVWVGGNGEVYEGQWKHGETDATASQHKPSRPSPSGG